MSTVALLVQVLPDARREGAASPADFMAARQQMAFTLGFHIVLASIGIGLPAITLLAEWRALRTGDAVYAELARRWMKAAGVLFAVGAVSGTVLSFEMGTLWPGFMDTYGQVFGSAFALEGIAFFIEAIFMGIYLYGWDRLSPRAHLATGVPVLIAGLLSASFVVTVNSWMNQPRGFRLVNGQVTDVDPLADAHGTLRGLDSFPADVRPPAEVVRTTTEVGRQPWIVYGVMRTEEAINPNPGLRFGLYIVLAVYTVLTLATISVLRRMRRPVPVPMREKTSASVGALHESR
jgi:cytochrome bd-type quinol oxidase subunit 1